MLLTFRNVCMTLEQDKIRGLREKTRCLRMEREILKKRRPTLRTK